MWNYVGSNTKQAPAGATIKTKKTVKAKQILKYCQLKGRNILIPSGNESRHDFEAKISPSQAMQIFNEKYKALLVDSKDEVAKITIKNIKNDSDKFSIRFATWPKSLESIFISIGNNKELQHHTVIYVNRF